MSEGTGTEVASAYASIEARLAGAQKLLRDADAAGRQAGQRAGSGFASTFVGTAAGVFTGVAGAMALNGLTQGLRFATDAAIGFNAQLERSHIGLTTLTGSVSLATDVIRDLQKQAKETPFSFDDILPTATSFLAAGRSVRTLTADVKGLTAALAAAGRTDSPSVQGAMLQLQQMISKGQIRYEDVRQLVNYIPSLYDDIANALGITKAAVADITTMAGNGPEAVDKLLAYWADRYGDNLEQLSHTLDGTVGNISDTLTQGFAAEGSAAFDKVKAAAEGFLVYLNSSEGQGVIEDLSDGLATAVDVGTGFVKFLWDSRDAIVAVGVAWTGLQLGRFAAGKGQALWAGSALGKDVASLVASRQAVQAAVEAGQGATDAAIRQVAYKQAVDAADASQAQFTKTLRTGTLTALKFAPAVGLIAQQLGLFGEEAKESTTLTYGLTGAMAGMAFGPWGAAIGAAGGLLLGMAQDSQKLVDAQQSVNDKLTEQRGVLEAAKDAWLAYQASKGSGDEGASDIDAENRRLRNEAVDAFAARMGGNRNAAAVLGDVSIEEIRRAAIAGGDAWTAMFGRINDSIAATREQISELMRDGFDTRVLSNAVDDVVSGTTLLNDAVDVARANARTIAADYGISEQAALQYGKAMDLTRGYVESAADGQARLAQLSDLQALALKGVAKGTEEAEFITALFAGQIEATKKAMADYADGIPAVAEGIWVLADGTEGLIANTEKYLGLIPGTTEGLSAVAAGVKAINEAQGDSETTWDDLIGGMVTGLGLSADKAREVAQQIQAIPDKKVTIDTLANWSPQALAAVGIPMSTVKTMTIRVTTEMIRDAPPMARETLRGIQSAQESAVATVQAWVDSLNNLMSGSSSSSGSGGSGGVVRQMAKIAAETLVTVKGIEKAYGKSLSEANRSSSAWVAVQNMFVEKQKRAIAEYEAAFAAGASEEELTRLKTIAEDYGRRAADAANDAAEAYERFRDAVKAASAAIKDARTADLSWYRDGGFGSNTRLSAAEVVSQFNRQQTIDARSYRQWITVQNTYADQAATALAKYNTALKNAQKDGKITEAEQTKLNGLLEDYNSWAAKAQDATENAAEAYERFREAVASAAQAIKDADAATRKWFSSNHLGSNTVLTYAEVVGHWRLEQKFANRSVAEWIALQNAAAVVLADRKRAYENYLVTAQADGKITEAEQARLDQLLAAYQEQALVVEDYADRAVNAFQRVADSIKQLVTGSMPELGQASKDFFGQDIAGSMEASTRALWDAKRSDLIRTKDALETLMTAGLPPAFLSEIVSGGSKSIQFFAGLDAAAMRGFESTWADIARLETVVGVSSQSVKTAGDVAIENAVKDMIQRLESIESSLPSKIGVAVGSALNKAGVH